MKKEAAILFLLLIIVGLASAMPELKVQNEKIQPGETILGTISISNNEQFSNPISSSDLKFFDGRKEIFIDKEILFFNNIYYFYAYPTNEGNLTIQIPNVLYKNNLDGNIGSITLEKELLVKTEIIPTNKTLNNITTIENGTKILSIKPGFVTSSKNDVIIKNLGNLELEIKIQGTTTTLQPLQSQRFYMSSSASNVSPVLTISSYKEFSIPGLFISANTNKTTPSSQLKLKLNKEYLHINSLVGESKEEQLELFSFSDENITNITLSSSSDWIKIENSKEITSSPILPRQTRNLTLSFNTENKGYFQGNITISFIPEETGEHQTIIMPVYEYVFPENTTIENLSISKDSCAQMGGISCNPITETCSTTEEYASDGFCCTSVCNPKPKENSTNTSYGWLWGILIFIALTIAGYFIYKKFKKVKPKKVEEKFTDITNAYQKRVSGGLSRN